MAAFQVPVPDAFSFDARDWRAWLARFERFRIASKIEDGASLVNLLVYTMGPKAENIFTSFGLSADDQKKYDTVKKKFDDHFHPKSNVIFERAQFNKRRQLQGETTESFITDIFKMVETCDYGDKRDELLRDRIVAGISDIKLSQKLQMESNLTVEKAVEMVRSSEQVRQQSQEMRAAPTPASVNAVHNGRNSSRGRQQNRSQANRSQSQYYRNTQSQFNSRTFSESNRPSPRHYNPQQRVYRLFTSQAQQQRPVQSVPNPSGKCGRCGLEEHRRNACPARQSKCRKCSRFGH
jgi:hypothetical protein